jgi:hypothetical protein
LEFWAGAWARHLIHVEWQQLGGEPSFNPVPQVAEMRREPTFMTGAAGQTSLPESGPSGPVRPDGNDLRLKVARWLRVSLHSGGEEPIVPVHPAERVFLLLVGKHCDSLENSS